MFSLRTSYPRFFVPRLLLILLVYAIAISSSAQPLVTITIGGSATEELTSTTPTIRFGFVVEEPQQVDIRLFPVTEGFVPTVTVIGPSGAQIVSSATLSEEGAIELTPNLQHGIHQIVVTGGAGRFLLLLEALAPAAPPIPLLDGQITPGQVNSSQPLVTYSFSSGFDPLIMVIDSGTGVFGPSVTLKDAATGDVLATIGDRMTGIQLRLPSPQMGYLLEVALSGASTNIAYTVCTTRASTPQLCAGITPVVITEPTAAPVSTQAVIITATPAPATLQPLPASSVCIAGSATGNLVNVRSGPSTQTPVVTTLSGMNIATVIGKLSDNSWYQVSANGQTGWMSAQVVRLGGPCQGVPNVALTAVPPTITPVFTASATTFIVPTAAPTLNFSLPPNYGTISVTSGFVPDPQTAGINAGGPVDVSYIGGGCAGFTSSAPDFSVNYTAGAFPTLRFYFIGSGDTTLIINSPGGSYFCVDDSFGTLNPTVDFNSPQSGRYDIWVGSFSSGYMIGGTLYITENTGNHP